MLQKASSRAWFVWLGVSAFLFYKYVLQVYPGIIASNLMAEFHLTGAGVGNLAAAFYYSYLVAQLFAGVMLDKYSPRVLISLALMICAVALCIFALTDTLAMAFFARILMGIGVSFATVGYLKMTSLWFPARQFAFVGSLLATAAMLGAVFGQGPLALLISYVGWHIALLLVGILGLLLAVYFAIVSNTKHNKLYSATNIAVFSWHDVIAVVKNKQNWYIACYGGFVFSPIAVFGGLWGNEFLITAHHVDTNTAASLLSAMFLGLAAGAPVISLLATYFDNKKALMLISAIVSAASLAVVVYLPGLSVMAVAILLLVFGFCSGAFMLGFAVAQELNALAVTATAVAFINTGEVIFSAFSEPLVGRLLDHGWDGGMLNGARQFSLSDYHGALAILIVYLGLACVFMFLVKTKHNK
jgi:MFS family permease